MTEVQQDSKGLKGFFSPPVLSASSYLCPFAQLSRKLPPALELQPGSEHALVPFSVA